MTKTFLSWFIKEIKAQILTFQNHNTKEEHWIALACLSFKEGGRHLLGICPSQTCLCRQAHVNHMITLARASSMGVTKAILSYGNSECKFYKPLNQTLSVGSFLSL